VLPVGQKRKGLIRVKCSSTRAATETSGQSRPRGRNVRWICD